MIKKVFACILILSLFGASFAFGEDLSKEELAAQLEHAHNMVRRLSYVFVRDQTTESYWRLIYWRGKCAKLMKQASGI
jgi:hypothetical protein